jgi:hypothetical protein
MLWEWDRADLRDISDTMDLVREYFFDGARSFYSFVMLSQHHIIIFRFESVLVYHTVRPSPYHRAVKNSGKDEQY